MHHSKPNFSRTPLLAGMTALALVLAGCDNNDPAAVATGTAPVTPTTTVSGVAAVGAPIVGGNVTLNCSGAGTIPTILPTGAGGGWTVTLPSSMLPCAASVSGGTLGTAGGTANVTTLYSLIASTTATAVTTNITTLTSLAMARAVQVATAQNLAAWYAAANLQLAAIANTHLPTAQSALQTALTTAGYMLPAGFNPFTVAFSAAAGNPYDDLMENLATAFAQASSTYAAWLQTFATASGTPALPAFTPPNEEEPGEEEPGEEVPTDPNNPLGLKNGIAITLGGHTWKLANTRVDRFAPQALRAENPQVSPTARADMTPFNGQSNVILFSAAITLKRVAGNSQTCGPTDASFTIDASAIAAPFDTVHAGTYTATSCTIQVDYITSRGGLGGTITSASLTNDRGNTITLANTRFRVYQHRDARDTAPTAVADDLYNVMSVTEGSFELPAGEYFRMNNFTGNLFGSSTSYGLSPDDGTEPFDGNASDRVVWGYQNGSFGATGTNTCGVLNGSGSRFNMRVWVGTYQSEYEYFAGQNIGSCTVTLDQTAGDLHRGHYTATLVASDSNSNFNSLDARTISISGIFKNFLLVPIRADGGNEGALPETGRRATMEVTDGNVHFVTGDSFLLTNTSQELIDGITGYRMDFRRVIDTQTTRNVDRIKRGVTIQFLQVPRSPQKTGQFTCPSTGNNVTTIALNTDQGVSYRTNTAGGSCMINVTSYTATEILGTYTATVVAPSAGPLLPDGDNTVTISGSFREAVVQPPPPNP